MRSADVIVIGLGAMGSAACLRVAERGASVLGLDRHRPPHTWGSTHGDTRITRRAIGEGPAYVPLVVRSHELWREIEAETGTSLLDECGGLVLAPTAAAPEPGDAADFFAITVASARTYGIEHELLDGTAIRERFPQFAAADDVRGYYEPGAGYVLPERAVAAQLQLAQRHGAQLHLDETVTRVEPTADGVSVHTASGVYTAGQVVVTAGPWLPQLLDDPSLSGLFGVYRQLLHWYELDAPAEAYSPGAFPVFIWQFAVESKRAIKEAGAAEDSPRYFYGFPLAGGSPGLKVATEQYSFTTTPETVDRSAHPAEAAAMHAACVAGRLPDVSARPVKSAVCLYTVTPDLDFVIDTLPSDDRVLIASPCSGHGFKHSAAIGEAIAQRLLEGSARVDLSPFSFTRFA